MLRLLTAALQPISSVERRRHLTQQVCVQLPTPADNVTLLASTAARRPCSNRLISPGRRTHSSKPAAAACAGRMMGRTDRQTDRRTLDGFIDFAPHTRFRLNDLGPDLQNISRQSYDYLTLTPKLRSTYDGRLIYKTSYGGRKAFLRCNSLAKL